MGYGEYEAGGALKVLGALVILIGLGLAGYLVYLSRSYWVYALVVFIVFLVLGAAMVSKGGYTRRQNTPMGRVEDVRDKQGRGSSSRFGVGRRTVSATSGPARSSRPESAIGAGTNIVDNVGTGDP